jgi:hypothetical protein
MQEDGGLTFVMVIAVAVIIIGIIVGMAAVTWAFVLIPH